MVWSIPSRRPATSTEGAGDDVYGLAVSEKVPPSRSVSDGSCTTQVMFDPAAPCMGIWIFANADATASRPKWGTAAQRWPGVHPLPAASSPVKDWVPCSLGLDSIYINHIPVAWRNERKSRQANRASAGNPAQIIPTVVVDRMILHRPTSMPSRALVLETRALDASDDAVSHRWYLDSKLQQPPGCWTMDAGH